MIYLNTFKFCSFNNDLDFQLQENCYNTKYPFGILSKNIIEKVEFETITIFYGVKWQWKNNSPKHNC